MCLINQYNIIVFVTLVAFILQHVHPQDTNFGKFSLNLDRFEICKGPKRNDCGNVTIDLINRTAVNYEMTLSKPAIITKGKVTARSNSSDLLRLQMKNPCDHLFLKQIMRTTLNATQNCVIKPGHYQTVFDINKIAQTYYSGAFIFGHFMFKALFMSDDCNLSCTEVEVTFVPKHN